MRTCVVLLALAATAAAGGRAAAAQTLRPTLGASVVAARLRSQLPAGTDRLSGAAFAGEGSLSLGRFVLSVGYLQGQVARGGAGTSARDLIEGRALLGVRPVPWLMVGGGPRGRAYVLPSGTQRWLFWELRARAEARFIGSAANGYVELWRAISADVNVPERFDHGQGGEAGLILRLARAPLEARVGYRIDHAVLGGGSRLETVDAVVVGLGLARR